MFRLRDRAKGFGLLEGNRDRPPGLELHDIPVALPVGWIDGAHLLVETNAAAHVCTAEGVVTSTFSVPTLGPVSFQGTTGVYSSRQNKIYSLSDGKVVWDGQTVVAGSNGSGFGALAGPYVVFAPTLSIVTPAGSSATSPPTVIAATCCPIARAVSPRSRK